MKLVTEDELIVTEWCSGGRYDSNLILETKAIQLNFEYSIVKTVDWNKLFFLV